MQTIKDFHIEWINVLYTPIVAAHGRKYRPAQKNLTTIEYTVASMFTVTDLLNAYPPGILSENPFYDANLIRYSDDCPHNFKRNLPQMPGKKEDKKLYRWLLRRSRSTRGVLITGLQIVFYADSGTVPGKTFSKTAAFCISMGLLSCYRQNKQIFAITRCEKK